MSLTSAILLLLSFPAFRGMAADRPILGGFGFKLGAVFDPTTASRSVGHYSYHLFAVTPTETFYPFTWYWLTLTKNNLIRTIEGRRDFPDMAACGAALNDVKAMIEGAQGDFGMDGRFVDAGLAGFSMSRATDANHYAEISLMCSSYSGTTSLSLSYDADWFGPHDFK
jgi:hypothetical protein